MNTKTITNNLRKVPVSVTGPYQHENLSIFLLHNPNTADTSRYVTLEEALDQKKVVVHETGQVGELLIENLFDDRDVYIQSCEIVRGGRQDRTIGVDFVVPAKSGRVPIPTFCVEMGRWHRRGAESEEVFSSSKNYLSSKPLKMAAKMYASQQAVWDSVAETQAKLSHSVAGSVHDADSPSSLELTLDNKKITAQRKKYRQSLAKIIDSQPAATGFVFAVNGQLSSGESYASHALFRKLWGKLLDAAVVEAVAESGGASKKTSSAVTVESVRHFLKKAETGSSKPRSISERVCLHTKRMRRSVVFETEDKALPHVRLHKNYIWEAGR